MKDNNAAWAIFCVLVILVLILVAFLICGQRGLASICGGAVLRNKKRYHGGRPDDLDSTKINKPLEFPLDQSHIEPQHQTLRKAINTAYTNYITAKRGLIDPNDEPVAGLDNLAHLVHTIFNSFGEMCDAVRGLTGGGY